MIVVGLRTVTGPSYDAPRFPRSCSVLRCSRPRQVKR
jgi:hypothetical protein